MSVPNWGTWIMWAGTLVGAVLLTMELSARGWPSPFTA